MTDTLAEARPNFPTRATRRPNWAHALPVDPVRPVLILFHGDAGTVPGERLVAGVRAAAVVESARAALAAGFGGVIVATDDPVALGAMPGGVIFDLDTPYAPFDFGARLRDIVGRFALHKPVVMGSGSLPLLSPADFERVARALDEPGVVVTNNLFSGDLTGWSPGDAVLAGAYALPQGPPCRDPTATSMS